MIALEIQGKVVHRCKNGRVNLTQLGLSQLHAHIPLGRWTSERYALNSYNSSKSLAYTMRVHMHRMPNHYEMLCILLCIYIIEVIVPPEDDGFTAPDPKKRKLDVQLAGWFASSVM